MFERLGSRTYAAVFLALGVLALLLAAGFRTQDLLLAGLTLGLYGLHLVSMRSIRDRQEEQAALLKEVGAALDDLSTPAADEGGVRETGGGGPGPAASGGDAAARTGGADAGVRRDESPSSAGPEPTGSQEAGGDLKVPRDLRIGTVAIVQEVLEPRQVSRIMSIQERKPEKSFGDIAVELDLLHPDQVEELRQVKRTGLYSKRKLTKAKAKLRAFLGQRGD